MSSWRFGDVQHSLSLSCDFILRLPLSGVCLRSQLLLFLTSLAAAVVSVCRWNRSRRRWNACAPQWDAIVEFDKFSLPGKADDRRKLNSVLFLVFFGGYFTLQMHYSASWVTSLEQELELEAVQHCICALLLLGLLAAWQVSGAASWLCCRSERSNLSVR